MSHSTTTGHTTDDLGTADHRGKVYVDGPGGVRVPFVEVSLADSPTRDGSTPNPPIRLYDTSGPGSRPTEGLPDLRGPWITGRGDVCEYEGRPVGRRDDGRGAVRRTAGAPRDLPPGGAARGARTAGR